MTDSRMPTTVDRILDVLDAGLQSSPEHGYGTDRSDRCARCTTRRPVEDGDLCADCRAWLLGDGPDVDPAVVDQAVADVAAAAEQLRQAFGVTFEAAAEVITKAVEAFQAAELDLSELSGPLVADVDVDMTGLRRPPNQARRRELDQLARHRRSHRRTNRWGPKPGR